MLCSIPASRTRRSICFPVSPSSFYFSGAVNARDLAENNSDSEAHPRLPPINPVFSPISPIRRAVGSGSDTSDPAQFWVRQKMQQCARSGNLNEALQHLNLLNSTILDYNGLLYCYLKQSRISVDNLSQIFSLMKRFGPSPNVWTFNILFNGLCAVGFLRDSFSVLEEMGRSNFVPSLSILKRLMKKSLSYSPCKKLSSVSSRNTFPKSLGLQIQPQAEEAFTDVNSKHEKNYCVQAVDAEYSAKPSNSRS